MRRSARARPPASAVGRDTTSRGCAPINGVASMLVTEDGAPVPEATGTVRAGAPLRFPTETVKASTVLPDLDRYQGPPLEYGRMEPTASDPVGAAAVRHDRRHSQCRPGQRARHAQHPRRALGDLPRRLRPPSFARAAAAGRAADLRDFPPAAGRAGARGRARRGLRPQSRSRRRCRCTASCSRSRTPFDTKDMRSTGGGDAAYDIDFPARDHVLVEQLRNKGAIIFAKAVNTEYNGRAGDPGGRNKPDKVLPSTLGYQRSTWAGNPSNPYDTTRSASLGSSSGSARLGQRQPGDGEPRRGNARLLPRAGQPQRGRADPAAQGHARLRRRRHRRRHLLRPQRHPSAARCATAP